MIDLVKELNQAGDYARLRLKRGKGYPTLYHRAASNIIYLRFRLKRKQTIVFWLTAFLLLSLAGNILLVAQ